MTKGSENAKKLERFFEKNMPKIAVIKEQNGEKGRKTYAITRSISIKSI